VYRFLLAWVVPDSPGWLVRAQARKEFHAERRAREEYQQQQSRKVETEPSGKWEGGGGDDELSHADMLAALELEDHPDEDDTVRISIQKNVHADPPRERSASLISERV